MHVCPICPVHGLDDRKALLQLSQGTWLPEADVYACELVCALPPGEEHIILLSECVS